MFFSTSKGKKPKTPLKNGLLSLYKDALDAVKGCLTSENESIRLKTAMWIIAKVENNPIGSTDARELLKKEATRTESVFQDWEAEKKVFDERKYQKLLAENGLK